MNDPQVITVIRNFEGSFEAEILRFELGGSCHDFPFAEMQMIWQKKFDGNKTIRCPQRFLYQFESIRVLQSMVFAQ